MISRRFSDGQILRFGSITLVALLLITAASFNLSKFPGFRGTSYTAEFTDASGIHEGNMVHVGGMRVGRVQDVTLDGAKVIVKFEVDNDVEFGEESRASIEVLNLLGEKYLEVTPAGKGQLDTDTAIPVTRTESAYDIVEVFGDLTTTTEDIDKAALKDAFNVLSDTVDSAAPEIQSSFEGLSRLSRTVASRDEQLQALFRSSKSVSRLLADRSADLVDLMGSADLVFQEVQRRKDAIHQLLVNARIMAAELRGLAEDNQKEIGPALQEVDDLLDTLILKEKELKATLSALGPYASILGNIIGTGPWFDAYAINMLGVFSGEFVPSGVNE